MEYEQMRAMEKSHVCAMCGSELVTIRDSENSVNRLACGKDKTHNGFKRRRSATERLAQGELDAVAGPGVQKDIEALAQRQQERFNMLPKADIATARALGLAEIEGVVTWANMIGLNAYLGHVCLYFGKPYTTIDGYYYLNNKRGEPYVIGTRTATANERKEYLIEEGWYCSIAEAWLLQEKIATIGVGIVTTDEKDVPSAKTPGQFRAPVVHLHPQRMAEKRAEWQLLRKLIPLEVKE